MTNTIVESIIADTRLAEEGAKRIDWARANMPIMGALATEFGAKRPFDNMRIGICLHVEAKTAVWLETLMAGGAEVFITGSPGSTQDDTAAALVNGEGAHVYARSDETYEDHLKHCEYVLRSQPDLIVDNGADLHSLIYARDEYTPLAKTLIGATEETTTGATRLRESIACGDFPTLSINDTMTKRIVENRFGVGSSVVDGLMRSTNIMLHGKRVVVIGYGFCGSGVAQRLRGMGSHVTVVDTEPLARLEAHMEGFVTSALEQCINNADVIITVTGHDDILQKKHFQLMCSGVIIANAGHFSTEIDIPAMEELSSETREIRPDITEYTLRDDKKIFLLSRGNLINLSAGDGNPIEIMDLGLAMQTLSLKHLIDNRGSLVNGVQPVPLEVERFVAQRAVDHWIE